MHEKYALTVTLSLDPQADADRDVRMLVFESVREMLFNVVKHAKVDRAAVDLALTAEGVVRITVQDQGAGFDSTIAFDESGEHRIGFGLFSIRERLLLLGGHLDLTSAPGQGTTFVLSVPRSATQRSESDLSQMTPVVGMPAMFSNEMPLVPQRPLRILIADDHADLREAILELLAQVPEFRVVGEAVNGHEAIAQALALHPDVVVMDVSMPLMDGVEATRRIHAELPDIHILGLSANDSFSALHPIEAAGAVGYFTKSKDMERLVDYLHVLHDSRLAPTLDRA